MANVEVLPDINILAAYVAGFVEACLDEGDCTHTFQFRDEALSRRSSLNLRAEEVKQRLTDLGAACDCEICLNVTPHLLA